MKTNVILDVSNLFYAAFYAYSREQDDILLAMANKSFMDMINKQSKEYTSDEIVLAFDGGKNWRKAYTRSKNALTVKKYKGHRRQKLTDSELAKLERFDEHVNEFREMLQTYTGLLVLHNDRLEADDLIAGYIMLHHKEKHIIVSQDRDYLQLQRFKNVKQIDPKTGKQLTLAEYDYDADFFMFEKCIRGDAGDNVMSSYPRIRSTKIKEAYTCEYTLNNIMQNTFTVDYIDPVSGDAKSKDFKTSEVFAENEMLMDLTLQPDVVWELIQTTVREAIENRGKYNMVKFLRYCGKMDFQHIIQNITNYNKLLKGPKLTV